MMRLLDATALPPGALDAASTFMTEHLPAARAMLADPDCTALAIILALAGHDHRDWRLALARDLAREAAPKRVNVVAGSPGPALEETLRFLADAPGVTGQYCLCHE
jgi:hypothetical protein